MPRLSTHFSLARLLREHSHHDTPPRSLQGHPHHDHGEQKADDTSGRESPDLNPRLGEEATPPRLNGQTTERQAPSFLAVECTKASDSAGGATSAPHHDAPEAGNPRGFGLPSHMCGLGEGANPPGPTALTPAREGTCSPEADQTKARDLGRGTERDDGADANKAADASDVAPAVTIDDVAPAVTIDDTKRGSSVDTQASRRPLEYP